MLFVIWGDNVDPPFISNSKYDFLILKLIPVLAGLLSAIVVIFYYKKYKNCSNTQQRMKSQFSEQGKIRSAMGIIFLPIFAYVWLWSAIVPPIKLWAFYTANDRWSQEYLLSKVNNCGNDYETGCTRLTFLDLKTDKKHSVRWYVDKTALVSLENKKINIIGEKGTFGFILNGIEW